MTTTLIPAFDPTAARAAAQACGARLDDDPHGPQARFDPPPHPAALADGAIALLPDWGIVSISGDEAVKFLHAQTTNDIEQQPADEVRLNGYCSPKGRLLAGGPLWREGAGLRFAVSRPLAEPLRKRLSMYVLRAKAKVEDVSDGFAVLGVCGKQAAAALVALGITPPELHRLARAEGGAGDALAIGLSPVGRIGARYWLVVPAASLQPLWSTLTTRLAPVDSDQWRTTEILAGEPRVVPATSESFVPQTLNWELIEGINFRKGCYPGQEIVARMHYRGKAKRRSFVGRLADGPMPAPGEDLFAAGTQDPVGVVVSAGPGLDGGSVLLYEAPIETALGEGVCSTDGRSLEPLPLPYAIEA